VVDIYDESYDNVFDDDEDLLDDSDDDDGRCEPYSGLLCYMYVGGRAVFVRSREQQARVETRLDGKSNLTRLRI